jgi:hypothetical protein
MQAEIALKTSSIKIRVKLDSSQHLRTQQFCSTQLLQYQWMKRLACYTVNVGTQKQKLCLTYVRKPKPKNLQVPHTVKIYTTNAITFQLVNYDFMKI